MTSRFGIIYKITNRVNGKIYIGQTRYKLIERIKQHMSGRYLIGKSIRKNGIDNFEIESVYTCDSQESLDSKEIEFIELFKTKHPMGYNLRDGGNSRGKWHEESKKKLSRSLRANKKISHKRMPVLRICPKTKEVKRYDYIRAVDTEGFLSRSVIQVLKGNLHHKRHAGYCWILEKDFDGNVDKIILKSKKMTGFKKRPIKPKLSNKA